VAPGTSTVTLRTASRAFASLQALAVPDKWAAIGSQQEWYRGKHSLPPSLSAKRATEMEVFAVLGCQFPVPSDGWATAET